MSDLSVEELYARQIKRRPAQEQWRLVELIARDMADEPAWGMHSARNVVPADIRALLVEVASRMGRTTDQVMTEWVEKYAESSLPRMDDGQEAARQRFQACLGLIDSGWPRAGDHDAIDADLAREYGRGLDEAS